jgi:hypothetical protein
MLTTATHMNRNIASIPPIDAYLVFSMTARLRLIVPYYTAYGKIFPGNRAFL